MKSKFLGFFNRLHPIVQCHQCRRGFVKDYGLHPSEDTNCKEKEAAAPYFIPMILNNLFDKSWIAYVTIGNYISISIIFILF